MVCDEVIKSGYQKDTCYNEVGMCAQYKLSIMDSHVNAIEKAFVTTPRER